MNEDINEQTVTPVPRDKLSDAISTLQFARLELTDILVRLTAAEHKVILALRLVQEAVAKKDARRGPTSPAPTP